MKAVNQHLGQCSADWKREGEDGGTLSAYETSGQWQPLLSCMVLMTKQSNSGCCTASEGDEEVGVCVRVYERGTILRYAATAEWQKERDRERVTEDMTRVRCWEEVAGDANPLFDSSTFGFIQVSCKGFSSELNVRGQTGELKILTSIHSWRGH